MVSASVDFVPRAGQHGGQKQLEGSRVKTEGLELLNEIAVGVDKAFLQLAKQPASGGIAWEVSKVLELRVQFFVLLASVGKKVGGH
ncbi:hypothetical protein SAMN05414139_10841 [Burkholderia sp. D7]|nr:hypothetical protein SAMN05414139_10841 [Burkholderia sp. D7]